eukprot:gene15780-11300_t
MANVAEKGCVSVSVRGTLKVHVRYSEALFLDPREVTQCNSISVRFFVELKEQLCQGSFPIGVGDELFDPIASYAPVPAVHLPEPVTSLTDGGFGDTVNSGSKLEGVVVPVGGLSPAVPAAVSRVEGADATCFRGDVPNWGHFELSGAAADWQPFVPLGFWGDEGAKGFRDDGAGRWACIFLIPVPCPEAPPSILFPGRFVNGKSRQCPEQSG